MRATPTALSTPIQNKDIKDVFRINKKDDPLSSRVIVEFLSVSTKETMIKELGDLILETGNVNYTQLT